MSTFRDANGTEWQMDYDGCFWVLRQWAQANAQVSALSTVSSGELRNLNFNASLFRRERERHYLEQSEVLTNQLLADGNRAISTLAARHAETSRLKEQAQSMFAATHTHNMQQIDNNVTFGENMVTMTRLVRDVSAIVFMCIVPVALAGGSIGIGTAMTARLAGSIFQGVGTYQDTGNAGAAIANTNFAFTSSLMSLPPGASRVAQVVFTIHNTGNTVVRNAAISYITPGANGSRPFTEAIRAQVVQEMGGAAANRMLGDIGGKIAMAVLPVTLQSGAENSQTASSSSENQEPSTSTGQLISELPEGLRQSALQGWLNRQQSERDRAQGERAWRSTPFYQFMATGDPRALMSSGERYIRDNLLRPT